MHRLITELPRTITLIVIEHDMDIVLDISDHIVVLDYGRVLAEGTPAEIRASAVVRERYLAGRPDWQSGL
jgi:branched-chain amino acid transport system ATP-binding protein